MKKYHIAVLPGDGIGPEIMEEAKKILGVVAKRAGVQFEMEEGLVGGAAYDRYGTPLPEAVMKMAAASDAVLLGAVGGPKWEPLDYSLRPERGLLGLRSGLGLYANLRPVVVFEDLIDASPFKAGGDPGDRPPHRPRTRRGRLFRQTPGRPGGERPADRDQHDGLYRGGDPADR